MDTLHIIRNSEGYVMDTLHIIRNSEGYVMDTLHIIRNSEGIQGLKNPLARRPGLVIIHF
jgi:hypothetical protein